MRPKIEYATKERLVDVARGVSDSVPDDRDVTVEEALTAVLDHIESTDGAATEPEIRLGEFESQSGGNRFE